MLIIADATLIGHVDVFTGIDKNTKIIINGRQEDYKNLKLVSKNIYFTPATETALEIFGKNIVNTIILGAFAKYTGLISLNSLEKAIREKFKDKGEEIIKKNIQAIKKIYEK